MDTKSLHAYIHGPDPTLISKWIETITTDFEHKETVDMTGEIGLRIMRFDGKYESFEMEQHAGTGWLELKVSPRSLDSVFSEWSDIQFGERLVDDLGGITLVDCGGVYVDPLAPFIVRISAHKMEIVKLPAKIGDPFDEGLTSLIKNR